MHVRSIPFLATATLSFCIGCGTADPKDGAAEDRDVANDARVGPAATPLTNTSLRFDGAYHHTEGRHHYFMRFFPEGNVVLINGIDSTATQSFLRGYLKADTRTNGVQGIHNVLVTQRNDSLFFVTRPMKGEIDYSGVVFGRDSVRFLRHSHINGRRMLYTYVFEPDKTS